MNVIELMTTRFWVFAGVLNLFSIFSNHLMIKHRSLYSIT